ncbi:MAG: YcgN family cysteine cluster protein [Gammaproteobacteria bacterium]
MSNNRFWINTALQDMTPSQFEAVCDGCGRCCVHKLEDEDSGEIVYTDVACRLLDTETCRCTDYAQRTERVAACVKMSPDDLAGLAFLPDSCAYRRLDEGHGLAPWHPLVSGASLVAQNSPISMAGRVVSETYIHPDEIGERLLHDIACSPRAK